MIQRLKIENFRNHIKTDISFDKITVLIGSNGSGKSNILEAVGMISFCRSFRNENAKNLIKYDQDFCKINSDHLEVILSKTPRLSLRAKENGAVRKLSDFIGIIPSVIFSPETLSIVTGSPGERRRFLDLLICQFDKDYLSCLIDYERIRKQRNFLLQRIFERLSEESELLFWDEKLIENAQKIYSKRNESVDFFNQFLSEVYAKIAGDPASQLFVRYEPKVNLLELLHNNRRREIAAGKTLFGPHRDDFSFILNNVELANFASRGEIRSAVMALKVAEIAFLKEQRKKSYRNTEPVLLLDDIFSEFDKERREHLGEIIQQYQTIITTTESEHLSSDLIRKAKIIKVKNGKIE